MELIHVSSPAAARRGTEIVVRHRHTDLRRGLEHRELHVLSTPDGLRHAAQVVGIEVEPDDTIYVIAIGARLPEDLAGERIEGLDPARHDLALHEIVDLLADL